MTIGSPLPRLARLVAGLSTALVLALPAGGASAQSLNQCAILVNCSQPQVIGPAPVVQVAQSIPSPMADLKIRQAAFHPSPR